MSRSDPPAAELTRGATPLVSPPSEPSGLLTVRVQERPTYTLLTPVGELDLSTVNAFSRRLCEALAQAGHVILDLRVLTFIDSAGLHSLLAARRRATAAHQRLEVVCGPGQVRRMLSLSGLDQLVEMIEPPSPLLMVGDARAVAA